MTDSMKVAHKSLSAEADSSVCEGWPWCALCSVWRIWCKKLWTVGRSWNTT